VPRAHESPADEAVTEGNFGEQDIDWGALDDRIKEADAAMLDLMGHADLGPMRTLLLDYQNDLHTTSYICEHMEHRASYCWTRASELNPDHRDCICDRMVEHVGDQYDQECRLGIPWPLVY
jgi:hypothetical protein